MSRKRAAFTMIELIFVIVIIGLLAAVAIPRLAATREDARIASEVASLRQTITNLQTAWTARGRDALTENAHTRLHESTDCFWAQLGLYSDNKAYISIAPIDHYAGGKDPNDCDPNRAVRNKIYQKARELGLITTTSGWTNIYLEGSRIVY